MTQTRKIKDLPVIPAIDDADEVIVRDVSASDPAQAVTKTTIAALREAMGGGGDASTWSQYPATQDVDMDGHKITGLPSPTDAADAATKQYVDTASAAVPTMIERGTSRVVIASNGDIEIYRAGTRVAFFWGDSGGQIIFGGSVGARLTLPETTSGHASIRSGGYQSAMTSTSYLQLPSGVASYMHGVHLAKAAYDTLASMPALPDLEWWDPVWTPVSNVDSASNVECSYTRTYRAAGGSLVTLEGTIEVTPDAAGQCVVQANLPIARVGSDLLAGTAMAMEVTPPGHVVAVASVSSTTLTLGFIAEGADPYLVGFRASYREA